MRHHHEAQPAIHPLNINRIAHICVKFLSISLICLKSGGYPEDGRRVLPPKGGRQCDK